MIPETDDGGLDGNRPAHKGIARVHVYGAGITGLTVAHELALRGFRVRVIDPALELNELGQLEWAGRPLQQRLAVGGGARTRFLRVERGAMGNFLKGTEGERSEDFRVHVAYPSAFKPDDKTGLVPKSELPRLLDFLNRCGHFTRGEPAGLLHIRIPPSVKDRERNRANAAALRRFLTSASPLEVKVPEARVVILDEEEARKMGPLTPIPPRKLDEDAEGLWLELVHLLPCDRGMPLFPAYSRHLLSTLEKTPLLDAQGHATGRTVADNLVPASLHGIAARGRRIRLLRGSPAPASPDWMRELKDLAASGYTPSDTHQLTLRLWRYLCTSPERRKAEYEKVTWWEYLEGHDAKTGARRYQYSQAFKEDMRLLPRALAGVDGAWGDARSCGNALVQLYLHPLRPPARPEGTLNGPTTLAWLRPWRRYLQETLKVEFHAGKLTRLELDSNSGRLKPFWKPREKPEAEDTEVRLRAPEAPFEDVTEAVDYFVIATDAATAETLTKGLPVVGVPGKLRGFTTAVPANPRGPEPEVVDAPRPFPGRVPWDRFQTLTGVQFFFPASVRLAEGALVFLDTPLGLSALSRQQHWASPPTFDRDGFGAVLSVDLLSCEPGKAGQPGPADSPPAELAREAWRQLQEAAGQHAQALPGAAQPGAPLPLPAWFHVDSEKSSGRNGTPYLMPIVGDWEQRPGAEPWDSLRPRLPAAASMEEGVWQPLHGGYPVHWGQLVFAGPYLKTFTRAGGMEAANESARHAVNAILAHHLARHGYQEPPPPSASRPAMPGLPGPPGIPMEPPAFRMTPLGEYCPIWDPEQHELPELASLRALDAKLLAAGQPHVWDVLRLEPLALPLIPTLKPMGGAEALLELLRKVREGLEALLKGTMPGVGPPL